MSAAGSLLITIKAETESLRNDLNKAMGRIKQFEQETKRSSASVSDAFGRIGVGGETLKRSFGQVATGVLMMTGGFDKAGEAGKVLEQSLGAFLAGGPVGAGVALLTGAFKLLASETRDSGEAAKAAAKAYADALSDIDRQTKAVSDRLQGLRDEGRRLDLKALGVDVPAGSINAEREAGQLRALASADMARADTMRRLLDMQREFDALMEKRRLQQNKSFDRDAVRAIEGEMQAVQSRILAVKRANGLGVDAVNAGSARAEIAHIEEINARRLTTAQMLEDESDALAENAMRAAALKDTVAETTPVIREGAKAVDESREVWAQVVEETRLAGEAVRDWARDIQAAEDASQRQVDAAEELVRQYDSQRRIAEAVTDEERDRLEVLAKIEDLLASGRIGVDQAGGVFDSMMGAKAADRARKAREAMERESEKIGRDSGKKAGESFAESFGATVETRIDPFLTNVFQTIESGLTSAIVDGITNGGRNGADIFRNIVNQLLSQTISSILQSGLQSILGGVLGCGGGGIASLLGAGGGGASPLPLLDAG